MVYTKTPKKKKCIRCHKFKVLREFGRNCRTSDTYHYYCKECADSIALEAYKKKHKERLPFWVCPRCREATKLDIFPKKEFSRWKDFRCPKCNYSPCKNE